MSKQAKSLSLVDSISLIVSSIIGAGIFESAQVVARSIDSIQGILLLWLLGGVLSLFGALVYGQLLSKFPYDGGDYHFLSKAYGEKIGFLFSWSQITIIQPGSIAAMSFLFSSYFIEFLESLSINFTYSKSVLSSLLLVALFFTNIFSFNISKVFQNILTILSVLGLILIISVIFIVPINSINDPINTNSTSSIGLSMILILFAYGGWNQIGFVAAEIKDASSNLTKALSIGVLIVTLLYCLTNLSFTSVLGIDNVRESTSVATDTLSLIFPVASRPIISLLICITCLGSIQAIFFSGARIGFVLGQDFVIFKILSNWNNTREAPINSYLFQTLISLLVVFLTGTFANSIIYTSGVVWIFFFLSGLSLFILSRPKPFIPSVFCISCLYLAYSSFIYDIKGSLISIFIVLLGLIPYFLSKRASST